MRLAVLLLSAFGLRVCGGDTPPPPPPMASATLSAQATLEATHGGTVVGVEDQPLEVVVRDDGNVEAYLIGPQAPQHDIVVEVNSNEGLRPVSLTWNATTHRHEGHLVGASVAPGPVKVELVFEGRRRIGQAPLVVLVPPQPAMQVHVEAPAPRRPRARVDVHVDGPRPPRPRGHVDVRIHAPPPPSVHVDLQVGGHGHMRHGMRRSVRTVFGNHGMRRGMHRGMHRGRGRGHMKGHRRGRGHMRGHDRHHDDD